MTSELLTQIALLVISVSCLAWACVLIRREGRGWLKSVLLLVGLASLVGCGPMLNGHSGSGAKNSFVVVVHNQDLAYPETVVLSWWRDSTIAGISTRMILAGGEAAFAIGAMPDGFELDTTAYPAQLGGQVWQTPEYRDFYVFHVYYPSGFAFGAFPVSPLVK